jgi:hypothetical protein
MQGIPSSRAPTRTGWASTTSTRVGSDLEQSNKGFPTIRVLGATPNSSPNLYRSPDLSASPDPGKSLPRLPIPQPLLRPALPPIVPPQSPAPARSPCGRARSLFAPSERPISHLSYESRATNAIDDILNSYDSNDVPATPLSPNIPVSPTTLYSPTTPGRFSRFSRFTTVFEDVVHMKVMPVYFAKGAVTKTAA